MPPKTARKRVLKQGARDPRFLRYENSVFPPEKGVEIAGIIVISHYVYGIKTHSLKRAGMPGFHPFNL
jgi:hypothetical protein